MHVCVVGVDPASCRHHQSLDIAIVAGIVGARSASQNVDHVVMAAHETIGTEMGRLHLVMAPDVVWKGYFEATPYLAILLPGLDLFGLEAWVGVEEWRSEVGPQRLARKIRHMHAVPLRLMCLVRERGDGIAPTFYGRAARCFDSKRAFAECAECAFAAEWRDSDSLLAQVNIQLLIDQEAGLSLQLPDSPVDRDARF